MPAGISGHILGRQANQGWRNVDQATCVSPSPESLGVPAIRMPRPVKIRETTWRRLWGIRDSRGREVLCRRRLSSRERRAGKNVDAQCAVIEIILDTLDTAQ